MLQALRSGPALRSCFERINVRFRSNIAPSTMVSDQEERPNELAQTGAQAQMPALSAHEERRWNRVSGLVLSLLLPYFILLSAAEQ